MSLKYFLMYCLCCKMGNNQSTAEPKYRPTVSSSDAAPNYVPSSLRPILKSNELTAKATSTTVSGKTLDAPHEVLLENLAAPPRTHTHTHTGGRMKGHVCCRLKVRGYSWLWIRWVLLIKNQSGNFTTWLTVRECGWRWLSSMEGWKRMAIGVNGLHMSCVLSMSPGVTCLYWKLCYRPKLLKWLKLKKGMVLALLPVLKLLCGWASIKVELHHNNAHDQTMPPQSTFLFQQSPAPLQ